MSKWLTVFYRNKLVGELVGVEMIGEYLRIPIAIGEDGTVWFDEIKIKYCLINGSAGIKTWFKKDLEVVRKLPAFRRA